MADWKSLLIQPETSILNTIKVIDKSNPLLIAFVVDQERKLWGTVTDGDIRRGILNGFSIDAPVNLIMNPNPVSVSVKDSPARVNRVAERNELIKVIPVLDEKSKVINIKKANRFFRHKLSNSVLIMAGGLGTRLRPLTYDCPKPLLKVGKKPILEIIIDNFINHGFYNFYISINYKGKMIEDYFGDGSHKNISITYLKEEKRLGTAGALSLLDTIPQKPIVVMNGDLLTKVNFKQLLDFHNSSNSSATLCVREHEFQIPFGVVQIDNCQLKALKEKPTSKVFVNAGIYVLSPDVIKEIPKNEFYDMTDLFSDLLAKDQNSAVFPVHEYWMDIGRITEYEKADKIYSKLFES